MKYKVCDWGLLLEKNENFNASQILDCGQIFRYKKDGDAFVVYETDKMLKIIEEEDCVKIITSYPTRHARYLDLDTDYSAIISRIKGFSHVLGRACEYGKGIRILKQDLFEMIISFIISANNNIPKIKKSIEAVCAKFGKNMGEYYAFPTLSELETASEADFISCGLGYRAGQMVKAIKQLKTLDFKQLKTMPTKEARRELINLSGVGPKVADCVLLFGVGAKDVFPTDVWIKKVYKEDMGGSLDDASKISDFLVSQFGDLSGYAQQYLFYYKRSGVEL